MAFAWQLEIAKCAVCGSGLRIKRADEWRDDDCIRGIAKCMDCQHEYRIEDGIVILYTSEAVQQSANRC